MFGHADDDEGARFCHGVWRERVRDLQNAQRSNIELVSLQEQCKDLIVFALHMYGDLSWFLERILEAEHRTRAATDSCGNGLRFHDCRYKAFAFHVVLPFTDFWVLEDNVSRFNDVEVGRRVLDLHLESLIGG